MKNKLLEIAGLALIFVAGLGCSDEQKKKAATINRSSAEPIRIEISDANTHKNINLETVFDLADFREYGGSS